jgi:hypothetical protein
VNFFVGMFRQLKIFFLGGGNIRTRELNGISVIHLLLRLKGSRSLDNSVLLSPSASHDHQVEMVVPALH